MTRLPLSLDRTGVPPIKCQGIKTKLVPFILGSIRWDSGSSGRWIEPFLGSGVVALNLAPQRALLSDANPHIIEFYRSVQSGEINGVSVRDYLMAEGAKLRESNGEHYYVVRERFNKEKSPLDLLFLNRSCFNGLMRFNRRGEFNTPFGHKPGRFTTSYITKIVNQVRWAARQMSGRDWEFRVADWGSTLAEARDEDFVYLDPPYIGRHTDYYSAWGDDQAQRLAQFARGLPCGFALSMWLENRYRRNEHIDESWSGNEVRVCTHFYHVGSSEDLRAEMEEALVVRPGFAMADSGKQTTRIAMKDASQLALALQAA